MLCPHRVAAGPFQWSLFPVAHLGQEAQITPEELICLLDRTGLLLGVAEPEEREV